MYQRARFLRNTARTSRLSPYEVLGLTKAASQAEIKSKFKKLAMQHHPDRGGSAEKFKELNEAYEILSDEQRRRVYDMTGQTDPNAFNGGDSGPGFIRKGRPVYHEIAVTLEELYQGTSKKIKFNKDKSCHTCHGTGKAEICSACGGRGFYVIRQGPVIFQQPCPTCQTFKSCGTCQGRGSLKTQEIFDIQIPGAFTEEIVFENRGDERSAEIPGDVVFVITEKPNTKFQRISRFDLFTKAQVPLIDSLFASTFNLQFLDGKTRQIFRQQGMKIGKEIYRVKNLGLKDESGYFGDLYVEFEISMPKSTSEIADFTKALIEKQKNAPQVNSSAGVLQATALSDSDLARLNAKKVEWENERVESGSNGNRQQQADCVQQ
jgi:DnaJ-class molecular chaperone